jgi:hypothetical protein
VSFLPERGCSTSQAEGVGMTLHGPDPDLFRTKVFGARWYVDGLPADDIAPATDEKWPAVTTLKRAWSKPFRKKLETGELVSLDAYWAGEFIVDHLDTVESLSDDRDAALALVAGAPARRLNSAANRGTGVHTVMEDLMAGKGVGFVDPAVEPFVAGCKAFVEDWAPTPVASEFIVLNRSIGFGGTGDAILALQRDGKAWVALVDWKSRNGDHGAYEEDVAQIGGYSLAEYMVVLSPVDGRPMRMALPTLDAGLVVSLNAEGYAAYPVDLGDAQKAFLAMHVSWREHRDGQKAARQARGNPLVLASTTTTGNPAEGQTLSEPPLATPSRENGDQPATGSDASVGATESEPVAGPTPACVFGGCTDPGTEKIHRLDHSIYPACARHAEMWERLRSYSPELGVCGGCGIEPGYPHGVGCGSGLDGRPYQPGHVEVFDPPVETQDDPALLPARIAWLQARVDVIKAADGGKAVLARCWSEHPEVPTFPKGGPTTPAEVDVVSRICWDAERELGLPFPASDDPAVEAFEAEARAKGLV